jgi:hypothetical protein
VEEIMEEREDRSKRIRLMACWREFFVIRSAGGGICAH